MGLVSTGGLRLIGISGRELGLQSVEQVQVKRIDLLSEAGSFGVVKFRPELQ
jgi:hypothetical protein